jgi:hypothetical protein
MAYTPFKMKGNPMKRNFGIGATPAKMKKSPMKKDDKTLVAKSDSMDVAHDKFMKDRMKVLQNKAKKSADSLNTVRSKVINKAVEKKKKTKSIEDLNKEIDALNKKRSAMKMMKKSPNKLSEKERKARARKTLDAGPQTEYMKKYLRNNPDSKYNKGTKAGKMMKKGQIEAANKQQAKDKSMRRVKAAQEEIKKSPSKMKKSAMKLKKAPTKFNKGLKAAAAAGKLDKNPKFKAAVENAPAKMKKSAMKMKKSAMKLKKSPTKMGHKKK